MPVAGLPPTLEVTLGALLQHNHLTSWKVSGEGDSTVVVIRLRADPDTDNMACQQPPSNTQCFRKKPPSQISRDRRRAEERRRKETIREEFKASDHVGSGELHSLFMPTPPTYHTVSLCDTPLPSNNTPPQQQHARESRRASADVTVLETGTRGDQPNVIDLSAAALEHEEATESAGPLEKVEEAGCSVNVIRDYVGQLTDRSLQRKLRDKSRNKQFCSVLSSEDDPDAIVCESDDVIFRFTWTDADDTQPDFYWFVKRDTKDMTEEERTIYYRQLLWAPADRERIKDRIDAGLDVLNVIMDAVRFFLD